MAHDPSPAGKRFSDDLRRIREDRDVSVDEIHKQTRIARTLIESFEEGELYNHPTYNRVYLRSFVKAYADAVSISREVALKGLDAALDGSYQHALATQYLDGGEGGDASVELETESSTEPPESPESSAPSSEDDTSRRPAEGPTAGGPEGRGGIVGPPRAVGAEPEDEEIPTDQPPPETVSESGPAESASSDDPDDEAEEGKEAAAEEPTDSTSPSWPPVEEERDRDRPPDDEPADSAAEPEEEPSTEAPDMSGPEALRATPDDDDTAEEDPDDAETPDWMAEEGDASDAPDTPGQADPVGADASPDEAPSLGEGTGIVGEPTELGSGGTAPPAGPSEEPAPAASRSSDDGGLGGLLTNENQRMWLTGIGIAVVLLVLVGLGVAYITSDDEASSTAGNTAADSVTTATTTPPASGDTTAAGSDASPDTTAARDAQPPPANVTLGDDISLLVVADSNVSALRLQRDDDLRRPYWIVEGEASLFPFQDRAVISNEYDDIRLFIEGYPYPIAPADTVGGLEITREQAQAFVDTLRGDPPSLSVDTDTIPVGEPTN